MGNRDKMGADGATIRKYMFDMDFGPPVPGRRAVPEAEAQAAEPEPEPEENLPPPPTFTEEELQLAREAAFEEGRQHGLAEAAEQSERMLAMAMIDISSRLEAVKARQDELDDNHLRTAVRVAQAVLKKVLPGACEKYAFEEVARVVEECVGHVLDEPRMVVRVSAALADPIRDRLEAIASNQGYQGRVVVQTDDRMAATDCRVEWTDGGAERDQARLLRDIDEVVERALAGAQAADDQHPLGRV